MSVHGISKAAKQCRHAISRGLYLSDTRSFVWRVASAGPANSSFDACYTRSFSSTSNLQRGAKSSAPSKLSKDSSSFKPIFDGSRVSKGRRSGPRGRASLNRNVSNESAFRLSSERPEVGEDALPSRAQVVELLRNGARDLSGGSPDKSMVQVISAIARRLGVAEKELTSLVKAWLKTNPFSDANVSIKGKQKMEENSISIDSILADMKVYGARAIDRALLSTLFRWLREQQQARTIVFSPQLASIVETLDLRYPAEWYPYARAMRRKLILHVGPTNSGKTYNALCALAAARTGAFAGPLRLLATEVYSRFNAGTIGGLTPDNPRVCNLITGEERRIHDPFAGLESCTVEMMNLMKKFDVVVIDEIQMIGDAQRGTAWTNALLGIMAKEIHLCGEPSVVDLIKRIGEECGDEVIVKEYKRLSPLRVAKKSLLGNYNKVMRGDCVVTFSRSNIFAVKKTIEEETGLRVAVAYGGLPPEVREEQARGFNAPETKDGFDVMVASDAIGMGLNLKIKRIIFETLHKWDGVQEQPLSISQIKQIGGRAGRYSVPKAPESPSAPEDDFDPETAIESAQVLLPQEDTSGVVTCLEEDDMPFLREAMSSTTRPIERAALHPLPTQLEAFASFLPRSTTQAHVFEIFPVLSAGNANYFIPSFALAINLSKYIQENDQLSFSERWQLLNAPVNTRDPVMIRAFVDFTTSNSEDRVTQLTEWIAREMLANVLEEFRAAEASLLGKQAASTKAVTTTPLTKRFSRPVHLMQLESLHRCISLYLWLNFRFVMRFPQREEARLLKKETQDAIDLILQQMTVQRPKRGKRLHPVTERAKPAFRTI